MKTGKYIFTVYYGAPEAWEKYKHLAPEVYKPAFLKGSLAVWEFVYLEKSGDTNTIVQYLKRGIGIFIDVDGVLRHCKSTST